MTILVKVLEADELSLHSDKNSLECKKIAKLTSAVKNQTTGTNADGGNNRLVFQSQTKKTAPDQWSGAPL